MILITSANGKTGTALIEKLLQRNVACRAMTASAKSAVRLEGLGVSDIAIGNLRNAEDVLRACAGVSSVYYVTPNFSPDEAVMTDNLLAACRTMEDPRIVLHSVIHPQIQDLSHHWNRLFVEEKLLNDGVSWVILQPTSYMQNVVPQFSTIRETRVLAAPMPVDRALSLVDLDDVAEIAANVLVDRSFDFGIFELCGEPITLAEQAEIIGHLAGVSVAPRELDPENPGDGLGIPFTGTFGRDTMKRMYNYYATHGLRGNSKVLALLLGRPPTTYEAFARRELARVGMLGPTFV